MYTTPPQSFLAKKTITTLNFLKSIVVVVVVGHITARKKPCLMMCPTRRLYSENSMSCYFTELNED